MTQNASDASALAATCIGWLVERGLNGCDVAELLAGLARQLNAGGLAIDRAGCAVLTLHPQFVSQEIVWNIYDDTASTVFMTPAMMEAPDNRRGPYFHLVLTGTRYMRFRMDDMAGADDVPLLTRLGREGYTEYFGFFHPTGGTTATSRFARRLGLVPCVVGSFATRRPGGFSEAETACFASVSKALALAVKSRAAYDMAARLLDVYVGHSSGSQVLEGHITRGDIRRISCGIWLCDLRQSSRLVAQLPLDDYIALLNRYFDATAGAVMRCGGEVLKLIGDAVLGIFRTDRPDEDVEMRERALAASAAALESVRKLSALDHSLEVGIALHVGEVMYGNVGTDERLDFTVIGRAVNEAARLQELTKRLDHSALASASFVGPFRDRFASVGAHSVAGFDEPLEAFVLRQ